MSFIFGLQKTRDSLKEAFENLFEKYGREFDDDDEIDIMSLEVVRKSSKRDPEVQRPRKFGFLYKKEGEQFSEEEFDDDSETDEIENDPTDLEKIFNERSTALVSVSSSNQRNSNSSESEKKPRKTNKRSIQLTFDSVLLKILEMETSNRAKKVKILNCPKHQDDFSKECFDCSLINIVY